MNSAAVCREGLSARRSGRSLPAALRASVISAGVTLEAGGVGHVERCAQGSALVRVVVV